MDLGIGGGLSSVDFTDRLVTLMIKERSHLSNKMIAAFCFRMFALKRQRGSGFSGCFESFSLFYIFLLKLPGNLNRIPVNGKNKTTA